MRTGLSCMACGLCCRMSSRSTFSQMPSIVEYEFRGFEEHEWTYLFHPGDPQQPGVIEGKV